MVEAFRGENLRRIVLALVCILLAQGAVWYTGHFYAQFFIERVLKVDARLVNVLVMLAVVLSSPGYVFFGWLSDRIGRKPVMLLGMGLTLLLYFPGFHALTAAANPALERAAHASPVIVQADPDTCRLQFDLLGRNPPKSACDVLRTTLADAGVPYQLVHQRTGGEAQALIAGRQVVPGDAGWLGCRAAGRGERAYCAIAQVCAQSGGISAARRSGFHESTRPPRYPPGFHARLDGAVRSPGGSLGGTLPHLDPLHGTVGALQHWNRLGRRIAPRVCLCTCRGDRGYLLGSFLSRGLHGHQLYLLLAVAAGDLGAVTAINRSGPCRIGNDGRVVRRWGHSQRHSPCRGLRETLAADDHGSRNIIDVHAHYQPPAIRSMNLPGPMNAWDLQKQIADMDAAGVTRAVLSVTTPGVPATGEVGRRIARESNEYAAKLAADYGRRFGFFTCVPMDDMDAALSEVAYGFDVLKAQGVGLFTSYSGRWLGDAQFDPLFAEFERRGAVVYVHPTSAACCTRLIPEVADTLIEYGTDTTRAIASYVYRGGAALPPTCG